MPLQADLTGVQCCEKAGGLLALSEQVFGVPIARDQIDLFDHFCRISLTCLHDLLQVSELELGADDFNRLLINQAKEMTPRAAHLLTTTCELKLLKCDASFVFKAILLEPLDKLSIYLVSLLHERLFS